MKNIKKTASLFLAYLFVLSILPLGILAKTASAEGLPEYLKYSENYLISKIQYKDTSLISYSDSESRTHVFKRVQEDKEVVLEGDYYSTISDNYVGDSEGIYDFYNEKHLKSYLDKDLYVKEILSQKYGENIELFNATIAKVEENGDLWIIFSAYKNTYLRGIITPSKKIVENISYGTNVTDGGAWYYEGKYNQGEKPQYTLVNYDTEGNKKEFSLINSLIDNQKSEYPLSAMKYVVLNDNLYIDYYVDDALHTFKYDLTKPGDVVGEEITTFNLMNIYVDSNNEFWRVKDGYVQKFNDTSWTNIYKVDSRMNGLEVYDKNHMIVTGWWYEKNNQGYDEVKGIYTIINNEDIREPGNGQEGETPQNPTPGNNGGGTGSETDNGEDNKTPVIVDKGTDDTGNKFVEVSKLPNKDSVNSIEIDTKDSKAFTAEITDINTIKEGKGSLNIKGGNTVINLPFSTINKDLLKDGSKVVLTSKVEDNSDITKNIKGLKKVFNFELSVVDKDNNVTAIHQFNDGQAEITITLSDEDLKGLDKAKLAVFYYNEETKLFEVIDTKVNGNNVTFRTPHFSKYIIAEKADENTSGGETQNPPQENNSLEQSSNEKELPQTGSLATQNQVLAIGMLILISGAAILYSKRKRA